MNNYRHEIIKKEFAEGTPGHVVQARYFYFDIAHIDQVQLHILCGGYERCAPDFELDRKNLAFYTVKFTLGGKGTFTCKNRTHPLSFGSLTVFGPQTPHQFKTDPADPMEHIFIVFTGQQAGNLLDINHLADRRCIQVANPPFIAALTERILHVGLENPPFAQELCQQYLKSLLMEQTESDSQFNHDSDALDSFFRCKQYLDCHFADIHSVGQLAEACHLDIRYIARLFRRYKQLRPYDYLMQLKMNKAANLLLTKNFSVKQIAQMTGFDDPCHFSRIFKKSFSISPTEYRRSLC